MSIIGETPRRVRARTAADQGHRSAVTGDVLIEALQAITAAAARTPTIDTVLEAFIRHGTPLEVRSAVLWGLDDEHLRLVAAHGREPRDLDRYRWLPLNAHVPCSDAVVHDRPVICPDRADLVRRYPMIERLLSSTQSLVSLPVRRCGAVVGGLSVSFATPLLLDDHVRCFLESVGDLAGVVFDDRPLAEVVPLAVMRTAKAIDEDLALLHADTLDPTVPTDPPPPDDARSPQRSLEERVEFLERQMRNMRQVLMFLGAIANDRLDDGC